MASSLNNTATANAYSSTVQIVPALVGARINIQVSNAAVYWRWSLPGYDTQNWQNEEFLFPGKYSFDRTIGTAQFRSAAAGVPARVTATILTRGDIGA